jgi:AraC family transcriptional regulator of adaptative response/methylated-DNA-[protein]-cysteine methyltransferase
VRNPRGGNRLLCMKEQILFCTVRCALGVALVAKSERGVCALLLGDDAVELLRDLQQRFPRAELHEAALGPVVSRMVDLIAAPASALDVSLDPQGSEFQLRVWNALREIAPGSTQTYGEVARRIGAPGSAKEVGEACAANPIAVAIPCHRVVRMEGGLAGYRWGVRRKRGLLELEQR